MMGCLLLVDQNNNSPIENILIFYYTPLLKDQVNAELERRDLEEYSCVQ